MAAQIEPCWSPVATHMVEPTASPPRLTRCGHGAAPGAAAAHIMPRYNQSLYERLESSSGAPLTADWDTAQKRVGQVSRWIGATIRLRSDDSILTGSSRPLKHSAAGPRLRLVPGGAHGSLRDHETGRCTVPPNLSELPSGSARMTPSYRFVTPVTRLRRRCQHGASQARSVLTPKPRHNWGNRHPCTHRIEV